MTTIAPPINYWFTIIGTTAAVAALIFLGWVIVFYLQHKIAEDPNTCPECGQELPFPRNTQRPITCLREKK